MLHIANDVDLGNSSIGDRMNAEKRSRGGEAQLTTESPRIGLTQPPLSASKVPPERYPVATAANAAQLESNNIARRWKPAPTTKLASRLSYLARRIVLWIHISESTMT